MCRDPEQSSVACLLKIKVKTILRMRNKDKGPGVRNKAFRVTEEKKMCRVVGNEVQKGRE